MPYLLLQGKVSNAAYTHTGGVQHRRAMYVKKRDRCGIYLPCTERFTTTLDVPRHVLANLHQYKQRAWTCAMRRSVRQRNGRTGAIKKRKGTHSPSSFRQPTRMTYLYLAAKTLFYAQRDRVHGGGNDGRRDGCLRPARRGFARGRDGHQVVLLDEGVQHVLALGRPSQLHSLLFRADTDRERPSANRNDRAGLSVSALGKIYWGSGGLVV